MAVEQVPLSKIILDPRLQMREKMDSAIIDEYAECLMDLPPGKIVRGEAGELWLTDGWYRHGAHEKAGQRTMACEVRDGTFLDALADAAGANHGHGVKRTDKDKRRAVAILLTEELWQSRSDRMLAEACHVSNHLVADVRKKLPCGKIPTSQQRTDSTGRNQRATKPVVEKLRCPRCKRLWPNTNDSRPKCTACFILNQDAKLAAGTAEPPLPEIAVDDDGNEVPENLRAVFRWTKQFKLFERQLNAASKTAKQIENADPLKGKKPMDGKRHYGEMFGAIKNARYRVRAMRPALVCQECGGKGCDVCGPGYLTDEEVNAKEKS